MSSNSTDSTKKTINELIKSKMFEILESDKGFDKSIIKKLKELSNTNELNNQSKVTEIIKSAKGE